MNGLVLCGEPGSGKTTIAQEWAEAQGGVLLSFADALKKQLASSLSTFDNVAAH